LPVVGYIGLITPEVQASTVAGFRKGLGETGYVEGRTLAIEFRWAESQLERFPDTGITPHYGAVRPYPAHRYFRPHGVSRLCLSPWHRRVGSHVPYKSLVELRAAYMPDAAITS
jgi:hypothetical protein